MSSSFESHQFATDAIKRGQQHGWQVGELTSINGYARPWFQRNAEQAALPRLYISAGVHGDEPAGSLAAYELLQRPDWFEGIAVALFPLINPVGLVRRTRENVDGLDLNRDYREAQSPEVAGHHAVLMTLPAADIYLHLHEDWEAKGAYLYAVHPDATPSAMSQFLSAMGQYLPIERAVEIDGYPATDGVIRREELPERDDWPEPYYLADLHGAYHGYTLETPSELPIQQRVNAHVAAVRAAINFLHE